MSVSEQVRLLEDERDRLYTALSTIRDMLNGQNSSIAQSLRAVADSALKSEETK